MWKLFNLAATQILCENKVQWIQTVKNVIFGTFRNSQLWFLVNLSLFSGSKFTKIQNWVSQIVNIAIFEVQIFPKLISCKIEKQINSCIVVLYFTFWKFLEHSDIKIISLIWYSKVKEIIPLNFALFSG